MAFKITEIHAFIATDDEGTEGVIGETLTMPGFTQPVFMPFVMADRARLESLRPHAHQIARLSGKPVKLVRFTTREDVEDL